MPRATPAVIRAARATTREAGAGGSRDDAGGASSAGAHSAGGAGGASNSSSPCSYAVSGVPDDGVMYLCTAISRLLQQKGKGDFDLLFGGAFYTDNTHLSTLACSLTSKVAPAAGDVWELGEDHPGNCEVDYTAGSMSSSWISTTATPAVTGSASIKFLSATATHGTNKPEDVYYTFEVELTATMPGLTPDTQEVTVNGTFRFPSLPLGS